MPGYRPRPYTQELGYTADYHKVHDFLVRIHQNNPIAPTFPWAAWEWMFYFGYLTTDDLARFILWEDDTGIVALVTDDNNPLHIYVDSDPTYTDLLQHVLAHAVESHTAEEPLQVSISDDSPGRQRVARGVGFLPTQETDGASLLDLTGDLGYTLPEGFSVIDHASSFDLYKFNRCMWRGFNRKGEPDVSDAQMERRRTQLSGPYQDPSLSVMIVAPNGDYAAYCGMWHKPGTHYAYVEPVCTDPAWRKLGLGKAAVLEAARRCFLRGASQALVYSQIDFYFHLGFNPLPADRWWQYTNTPT